ncbi:hypothetical protein [Vibrio rotiferianus]|uniref:hypothetical protein n=1 Tax=Vibrio rotiferianus TaxID=190895 RepID=UPI00390B39AD
MAIREQLKKALCQSCDDALEFSNDETSLIGAEYLITVNVAKSIQQLNYSFGEPYKIYLEYPTWKVARDAIHYSFKFPRASSDTVRSGKVDIAIYNGKRLPAPECISVVEVKGFNPSKMKIIEDLARNLEYFSCGVDSSNSALSQTHFIALHSYKNTMSANKEKSNLKRIERRYREYLSNLSIPTIVKNNIEVFTIRRGTVPGVDEPYIQECGLTGSEGYHLMGVVVTFET